MSCAMLGVDVAQIDKSRRQLLARVRGQRGADSKNEG